MKFLCVIIAAAAVSTNALSPQNEIDPEELSCKLSVSTKGWLAIAEVAGKISMASEKHFPKVKPIMDTTHDQMKGSADIITVLPASFNLSREARFQLHQNCIAAPIGIQQLISTIREIYGDFYDRFAEECQQINTIAQDIMKDMQRCSP